MMSPEAVDRILSAVGAEVVPAALDRKALANDLEWAADFHAGAAKRAPDQRERLRDILRKSKQLQRLLTNDGAYGAISRTIPECPRVSVQNLIDATESALKPPHPSDSSATAAFIRAMSLDKRNAFEWLAGKRLPQLFYRHFQADVTLRNSNRKADTPYTRFAIAVLQELNINTPKGKRYEPETIVRAVSNAKVERKRRKS